MNTYLYYIDRQRASRRQRAAWRTWNAAKGHRRLQSKAQEDAATVREATGESLHVPANGVTRDMADKGSDRDG